MAPQMQFVQEMSELVYSVVKTEDLDLFEFAFGRVVVAVSDTLFTLLIEPVFSSSTIDSIRRKCMFDLKQDQ